MFVMSANSFLLALDMFRSKCIFNSIYIFFVFALQQAHGCGSQLPVYHGWYVASPLPSQVNYYSPSIRKVHHEPMETLSFGPMCLVPPFLPYPYEIFHVQRIIQQSEDVQYPDHRPYEGTDHYEVPMYETVDMEEEDDDKDVSYAVAGPGAAEMEDMRSTPYPESYYLPHYVANHHQMSVEAAVMGDNEPEEMAQYPPPEESEYEEELMIEPAVWDHYTQSQAYTPHYETESVEDHEGMAYNHETEVIEATEAPCHVEQTTVPEEIPESTPVPEVQPEEPVASASALSQHQQDLLQQMNEKYESEEETSPCDGYFERNAANLAQMLEQHLDHRHVRGSRSEGSDHAEASRLFTPIIKVLKNIFGSFMSLADKPYDPNAKPTEPEPVTTEKPEVIKQETTTKPAEVPTPTTQGPQDAQSVTTPEPESGATETPAPAA